ncbi:MAG: glycosyltransferase [Deltaproteobacteria bacterium]|nr:glycosyltransferase [Deltaproteobacteria bacterium]
MWLTIPCYNEASRLDVGEVARLLEDPRVDALLVNDGSTDRTAELLAEIAAKHPSRARVLELSPNGGKGEAVRRGMLEALSIGSRVVGYLDADFATPPRELSRLLDALEGSEAKVVLGARIARLGAVVERNAARHYLGRVFATAASTVLDLAVYDTQCGAKLFRDTPALREALAAPFRSRWAFDVELIGRLTAAASPLTKHDFLEVPLGEWRDKRGSKLAGPAMLKAGADVLKLGASVATRGKRAFFAR